MSDIHSAWSSTFIRRCRAAEELATVGYRHESEQLWRAAFTGLTSGEHTAALDASFLDAVRQLLAAPEPTERDWEERARALARWYRQSLPIPLHQRLQGGAGLALFAIALLTFLTRACTPSANSSAHYASVFAASKIADGDPTSEWLLPDGSPGWIDLALPRRRVVDEVVITNGRNLPYLDRALRKGRLTLYDDDREVERVQLSFSGLTPEPEPQVLKLSGKHATRIRIDVEEYFGLGAALAEVEVH